MNINGPDIWAKEHTNKIWRDQEDAKTYENLSIYRTGVIKKNIIEGVCNKKFDDSWWLEYEKFTKEISEEDVKLATIEPILEDCGFKKFLHSKDCYYRKEYREGRLKPVDYIVFEKGKPSIIIEAKRPGVDTNEYCIELDQLLQYMETYKVPFGCLTNGFSWVFTDGKYTKEVNICNFYPHLDKEDLKPIIEYFKTKSLH